MLGIIWGVFFFLLSGQNGRECQSSADRNLSQPQRLSTIDLLIGPTYGFSLDGCSLCAKTLPPGCLSFLNHCHGISGRLGPSRVETE